MAARRADPGAEMISCHFDGRKKRVILSLFLVLI
jgi:hypothetical protein